MSIRATAILVLSMCWSVAAGAQTNGGNKLSPGKVALLVQPKGIADVEILGTVLDDSDPVIRALAARIAGLLGRRELAPYLLELLEREPNATSAAAQVRALLYLRGADVLPQSRAAATRLGAAVAAEIAEWLGRVDPAQLAANLRELVGNLREPDTLIFASIAAMAVRQSPGALDSMAASMATSASGRVWGDFLNRLVNVDAKVIESGLTSADPAVREVTIWFVVGDAQPSRTVQIADVKLALATPSAAPRPDDTEWAAFGRELIERRLGKGDVTDRSDLIKARAKERYALTTLSRVPELTTQERAALGEVLPAPAASTIGNKPAAAVAAAETKPVNFRVRTFPSLGVGVFDSLLNALGCKLPSNDAAFGAARISYQRDGRPREIAIDTTTLTPACGSFVDYLARLTLAQPDQPILEDVSQWWVIAMDKSVISCADEDPPKVELAAAERIGGQVQVPHKIKDARPVYPEAMRLARISGTVVMQAMITATGCVSNAEVLRSVQLPLDVAALRAVSAWRFSPTLLDGRPVPVVMTVTVNFTLQ